MHRTFNIRGKNMHKYINIRGKNMHKSIENNIIK